MFLSKVTNTGKFNFSFLNYCLFQIVLRKCSVVFSAIKIPAKDPEGVAFSLIAIVDPVSRGAQKLGPILKVLQESLNCEVKVFLNCMEKNSDMPLKR